jgi:hypothetical protein
MCVRLVFDLLYTRWHCDPWLCGIAQKYLRVYVSQVYECASLWPWCSIGYLGIYLFRLLLRIVAVFDLISSYHSSCKERTLAEMTWYNLALKGHSDQLPVVDLNMRSYNNWAAAKLKAPMKGQWSKGFGRRPRGAYVAMHLLNEHLYAHAVVVYIFRLLMSFVMTYRIWCSSWFNVVNICEAMSISSIFTLDALITSMSTMQCVEHGVLTRMWLVTASVRVSRHVVDLTFRSRRPFLKPLN